MSQDRIDDLKRTLSLQQYNTLMDYYVEQGRPKDAAVTFDKLRAATGGSLTTEQRMQGFVLYYSVFELEKAKGLYRELTPKQKAQARRQFGEIQF